MKCDHLVRADVLKFALIFFRIISLIKHDCCKSAHSLCQEILFEGSYDECELSNGHIQQYVHFVKKCFHCNQVVRIEIT